MIITEAANASALKNPADEVFFKEVAPDFQKATVAALGQERFAGVAGDGVDSVLWFLQALGDLSSLCLDVNHHGIHSRKDEIPASGSKTLQTQRKLHPFPPKSAQLAEGPPFIRPPSWPTE